MDGIAVKEKRNEVAHALLERLESELGKSGGQNAMDIRNIAEAFERLISHG
jgi:hypothetical protein